MFKIAERTDLNQISLTGIRALVLIGLLIVKPRSFEEIRQAFIDYQIIEKSNSDDILRIDLNTIKLMGCEVSRASAKTNYKYVLTKHPFCLKFTEEEVLALKKVYGFVKQNADFSTLIEFHQMFQRISEYVADENIKEILLGISVLKYYDLQMIKDLLIDAKYNKILDLYYQTQNSKSHSKKQILLQQVVYKNEKIYLYGLDLDTQDSVVLNLRRVESIISRRYNDSDVESQEVKIKFSLKDINKEELDKKEIIVEENEKKFVIEGYYHNEFLATQRMLSFGNKCVVLEPLEFRQNIIKKIKEMREVYGC